MKLLKKKVCEIARVRKLENRKTSERLKILQKKIEEFPIFQAFVPSKNSCADFGAFRRPKQILSKDFWRKFFEIF